MLLLNEGTHATVQVWVPLGASESEGRGRFLAPRLSRTNYGVGVALSSVNRAMLVTQAVASSSPSLRTSPAMFGGKRADSPSLIVNSVSAAIASGSVGIGVPGRTTRVTVIGASTRKVKVPPDMYTRLTEESAGSRGSVASGADLMRASTRFAVQRPEPR